MNMFLKSAIDAVNRHGRVMTLTQIERVVDKIKGSVVEVPTDYMVKMYPKSIKVNQYNYPNLIGKDVIVFYLPNNDLAFTPKVNDKITCDGKVYVIREYDFHEANGVNCLFRLVGATG